MPSMRCEAGLALVEAVPKLRDAGRRCPAGADRHRHRHGRRRRSDRRRAGPGARRGGRDAQPCRAAAGDRRPNTVVIAAGTRRLLGDLFELQDLGPQDLKGIPDRCRPGRCSAPARSKAASRPCMQAAGLIPLTGRAGEAETLAHWSGAKAAAGDGQAVLLSGEAGIGKSRLVADLIERLAPSRTVGCVTTARRSTQRAPSHPIIGQLERATGFAPTDSAARLDKLDALLAGDRALRLRLPRHRRSVGSARSTRWSTRSTELAAARARAAGLRGCTLGRSVEPRMAGSRARADAASLRLLVVVTFRPEFAPPWKRLARRDDARPRAGCRRRDANAMIDRRGRDRRLPAKSAATSSNAPTASRCSFRR